MDRHLLTEADVQSTRLSARQREALSYALDRSGLPKEAKVYLFGSRADPEAAGGDVDLLVYASGVDRYELAKAIRRAYQQRLDERIDVLVIDPERADAAQSAFVRTLKKVSIR